MNDVALLDDSSQDLLSMSDTHKGFVTVRVDKQLFGVPVLAVRDVLRSMKIANVPLSPDEIAGSLNLRGRIVTALDIRVILGMQARESTDDATHVVVEHNDELYSFMVDNVGEVLNLPSERIDKTPANMDKGWQEMALGVCRLDTELLIILDVQSMLTFSG